MFRPEIAKEEINRMEVRQFEGEIRIIDDMHSYNKAMEEIRHHSYLGFDTETRPAFRKGEVNDIALIQLSNEDVAWLFRVNKIGMPPALLKLFESDRFLKIGVGLKDDMRKMRQLASFNPAGFLELQKYVEAFNIESKSLKKLVAIVLGYKISKSQQISNWEAKELSDKQIRYAATDAWVSLMVYNKLKSSLKNLQ
ncbi:MAG: 3'-5' exonuclease domain-containing protein 2 [Bacteroidales bacterium]|nr:3'-5' exonuclease domain-containing protein 2 [Bacteroidales bacterium]